MDYQTHELYHSAFRAARQDSIDPSQQPPLTGSQLPKLESSVGATRILFVNSAPANAHEIDKRCLDLILGSRRWKLTASASGSITQTGYYGGGSTEIKVEGMFDTLGVSMDGWSGGWSGGVGSSSNIYTRSFDNGAVSQLEGKGYRVSRSTNQESDEEKLVDTPVYNFYTSSGGWSSAGGSMFPAFSCSQSGMALKYNEATNESTVETTKFSESKSYSKAGKFTCSGQHTGGCSGSGMSFVVKTLYITQDKCYIDFAVSFGLGDQYSGDSVAISDEPMFYSSFDPQTYTATQKSKVHQSSVSMTILGKPNSRYKLYQQRGIEGEFQSASVGNIKVDIVQEEAI